MNSNRTNGAHDYSVSMVRWAEDTETTDGSLLDLLGGIGNGRWHKQVSEVRFAYTKGQEEARAQGLADADFKRHVKKFTDPLKKRLPAILWSGSFSRRSGDALKKHSGVICVDLDHLDDRLESVRDLICADPHTLAAFVSPTGTGLKVLFKCDPELEHMASFRAAEHYVLEHFGIEVDRACKDVARMCFVSYDPHCFVANDAIPLPYPPEKTEFVAPIDSKPGAALAGVLHPGDDYDLRADVPALLTTHGWKKFGRDGWTRPGKDSGVSATWNRVPGRFYVFSSEAAPFEPNHVYRPWHVFALLECGGVWKDAARKLGEQGFGKQAQAPRIATAPPDDVQAQLDAQNEDVSGKSDILPEIPQNPPHMGYEWPKPQSADEFCENPPPTPQELIAGILYVGGTMLLSGPSKSHKTFSALDVGIAIAAGDKWLGHSCSKAPVLYLNLELQDFASADRISKISAARGHRPPHDLKIWNLRGHTITLTALTVQLPIMIKEHGAKVVCIDPHYKVSAVSDMEENSNDSQGKLLTLLEGLCSQAGAALIITHHFAKGDASSKNAIDRASGGGVFARWGDVMMTFSEHAEPDCMSVEMALRNFAPVKPFVVRWEYPRWQRDDSLDATELKRAKHGGFQEQVSPDSLLESLGSNLFTAKEWIAASGLTSATFYRKRQTLLDQGKIVCHAGIYKRK